MRYLSILSLSFCSNRRLSFSMCFMSFSINRCLSTAPSLVTSITLLPSNSFPLPLSWSISNTEVLSRLNVGSLSIAAHCSSSSSSSSMIESPPASGVEAWCWNDDWVLFPIVVSSILWTDIFVFFSWPSVRLSIMSIVDNFLYF